MKEITNWQNAVVFDIEADNLLDEATKIHCMSWHENGEMYTTESYPLIAGKLLECAKQGIPVVAHNGISYDIPLVEKLLCVDLSKLMVIDTLMLAWALEPNRPKYGLEYFGVTYGIPKPQIDDWENLTPQEYMHRCEEDVKINVALWEDYKERLTDMYSRVKEVIDDGVVGGRRVSQDETLYIDRYVNNSSVEEYINRYLQFLMYKGDTGRLREKTRFLADVDHIVRERDALEEIIVKAKETVESIMPPVPKYTKKSYPKNPKKNDRTLSVHGKAWNDALDGINKYDSLGNDLTLVVNATEIKILKGYEEPNANSPAQVKSFLFSKGWEPRTFKFEEDKPAMKEWIESGRQGRKPKQRAIAQITKDGDGGKVLCESVEELAEESPEIAAYANYGMLKHRLGLFNGFLRDVKDGYLTAGVGGYTNTLRDKHRELVNLPSVDKAYGKELRGSLIAGRGRIALGSDLSSLEDRVKHHFMLAYDPDYVATMMQDDYDPHIQMALTAKLITQAEFDDFKQGIKSENAKKARKMGKACNYASVYGAGAATIARSAGVSKELGEKLHKAYWELNDSVKRIAEDQETIKDAKGQLWLINPVNGFCYSLRAKKDIFSTLCQGTGSFFFDRWVDNVLEAMQREFGVKRLSAAFHDEFVAVFKDTESNREIMERITHEAIEAVNKEYLLRRDLGCDVQFGETYADIH